MFVDSPSSSPMPVEKHLYDQANCRTDRSDPVIMSFTCAQGTEVRSNSRIKCNSSEDTLYQA